MIITSGVGGENTPGDAYYEQIRKEINRLNSIMQDAPADKKMGFSLSPGGILNAYREGDVSFDNAVLHINEMKDSAIKVAREQGAAEMRDACGREVARFHLYGVQHRENPSFDTVCGTIAKIIKSLGPLSSLEDRVRRETVEKIRKGLWLDDVETVSTVIEGEE